MFDLRSDTVTRPTPAMRAAMAAAEVGDDVFGEDPTVNRLQRHAADLFGKEDALFIPSGTMGNQISLGALTRPGEEVIVEERAHVLLNEGGAAARWWGVQLSTVHGERGCPRDEDVERVIRSPDVHHPITSVLSLENTHNYAGGAVLPQARVDALAALARGRGLRLHMDGARVFNAAVASGLPVARIARDMDAVSLCLSKGLGAPVGSLVVGSRDLVATARRLRKALGGGMRQAGVLAAAGLLALEEGPAQLAADHRRARSFAEEVARLPGVELDARGIETNIVFVTTRGDARVAEQALRERHVLAIALDPQRVRFVFHRDAGDDALEAAVAACRAVFR
ncbi:MAG TPA: GntG family PLP-dependent aldolase [Planctomycetota bacterium]|nr:GntG family PLP-dependent aldolase [Planctomycetota bacterium]